MPHGAGKGERVRQERTARPATAAAWQTPPGARPNRGAIGASFRPGTRVGRLIPNASSGLEEWSHIPLRREDKTRLTGPLTPLRPILACASRSAAYVGNDVHCATIDRSEEHTSELQSLMRTSYAV